MKTFFFVIFTIIIIAIASFIAYVSYDYLKEKNSIQFTPIILPEDLLEENNASSTDNFATSTIDRSSWKSYSNDELGYKVSYPEDLIVNKDERTLILVFPKKNYFSWPLEDNIRVTITASSTCDISGLAGYEISSSSKVFIANKEFNVSKITDIATGNITKIEVYEINRGNFCYSVVYHSRGTNGAGFYVDDPILIKKYDDKHEKEVGFVMDNFIGILESFEFVATE